MSIPSNKLYNDGLIFNDENFDEILGAYVPENYLYEMGIGHEVLFKIQNEMKQLNNYCTVILNTTEKEIYSNEKKLDDYKSEITKRELHEYEDPYLEIEDSEQNIVDWKNNFSFVGPATTLLLLHIFVEKSLSSLCKHFSPSRTIRPKKNSDESVFQSYIRFLTLECSINFKISNDLVILLNESRIIRNKFAHGDWDNINEKIKKINLVNAFSTVTDMLYIIEEAVGEYYENKKNNLNDTDKNTKE